jgi:hypothetical protein
MSVRPKDMARTMDMVDTDVAVDELGIGTNSIVSIVLESM